MPHKRAHKYQSSQKRSSFSIDIIKNHIRWLNNELIIENLHLFKYILATSNVYFDIAMHLHTFALDTYFVIHFQ